jgi:hypothetical protein
MDRPYYADESVTLYHGDCREITEWLASASDEPSVTEGGSVDLGRALAANCPHCGSKAKHGERIGCCSGCKTLFTSMSAFDKHRRRLTCVDPEEAGLVPRVLKTDPTVMAWGWPTGDREYN